MSKRFHDESGDLYVSVEEQVAKRRLTFRFSIKTCKNVC